MNIYAKYNSHGPVLVETRELVFSGGEQHISIHFKNRQNITSIFVEANITSTGELIKVMSAKNAIDNIFKGSRRPEVNAILPYLPYARSDRVCAPGEEFGLQMFGTILNAAKFNTVYTFDVHSDKAFDYVDNLVNIPQEKLIKARYSDFYGKYDYIVSPDEGAIEKAKKVAELLNLPVVPAFKKRDPETGKLSVFGIDPGHGHRGIDPDVLIVDDICDGGGTFLGLVDVLKNQWNSGKIDLYVTHGIFSKGVLTLVENGINSVHTFNLLYNGSHQYLANANEKAYADIINEIFKEGK